MFKGSLGVERTVEITSSSLWFGQTNHMSLSFWTQCERPGKDKGDIRVPLRAILSPFPPLPSFSLDKHYQPGVHLLWGAGEIDFS